jgi:hypothetical protein
MPRPLVLSLLPIFAALSAPIVANAEDWRVCTANMGDLTPGHERIVWTVTQPFEVSAIADWRQQFEASKAERRAYAGGRGMIAPDGSFACTEGSPDRASAWQERENMGARFRERLDGFQKLGRPDGIAWEDWQWTPAGAASAPAIAASVDDSGAAADDDSGDGAQAAAAEQQRQAEAAEAEARRKQELANAQAERDRLAAEKAKLEREIAQAKAERDRLAAEKTQRERESASTDTDANRCVTSPSLRENDTFQGNTAAYVSNGCSTPVDVRICLMKEGQGWNCGMTYGLAPQKSWSHSSFKATGQVFMDARVAGSTRKMAAPE